MGLSQYRNAVASGPRWDTEGLSELDPRLPRYGTD
jgi:hypothetical protein